MTLICFTYVVILIGLSSASETTIAKDVIDKLNLILSRTIDIEEKLSDYAELKHGLDEVNEKLNGYEELRLQLDIANEKLNGYEELKQQLDTANEQLAVLVKSVGKVESVYDCGWPELPNGHFEGESTFYRDVLHAVCDEGYSCSGYEELTCMTDGKWSSMPKCKQDCLAPPIPNSLENDIEKSYPYGYRIAINCKLGYRRHGGNYQTCDSEDGWRGLDVRCDLADCGLPPYDDNGDYGVYNTTYNSTVSLTCNQGYQRVGEEVIRCTGNSLWSGRQTCIQRICVDYTTGDGTNATECFLSKPNSGFFHTNVETMEAISYREPNECIHYCLVNHPSFSHVSLDRSQCKCVKRTRSDDAMYPYFFHSQFMYFRKTDQSTYQFLTYH